MAWGIRPGFRGDLNLVRRRVEPREGSDRVRIRYEPARRCTESCAACSVACLEVNMRGRETRPKPLWPQWTGYRSRKPCLQKRLRLRNIPLWKTPRLSEKGRQGIAVRTKWQSGSQIWQHLDWGIKWKRPARQRQVPPGENQPDLSRKIYPVCHRFHQENSGSRRVDR